MKGSRVATVQLGRECGGEEVGGGRRRVGIVGEVGPCFRPAHEPRRLVVGPRGILRRLERPQPDSGLPILLCTLH